MPAEAPRPERDEVVEALDRLRIASPSCSGGTFPGGVIRGEDVALVIRSHGALQRRAEDAERLAGVGVQAREDTMSGELCFAGQNARIPVRAVLSFTRAGYPPEAIQREYPTLSLLEITAAAALTAAAKGTGTDA